MLLLPPELQQQSEAEVKVHINKLLLKISTPLEVALVHAAAGVAYHLSETAQDRLYLFDVRA